MLPNCIRNSVLFTMLAVAGCMVFSSPTAAYEVLSPPIKDKVLINARRTEKHLVIKAADRNEAANLVVSGEGGKQPLKPLGTWEKDGAVYVHYLLVLQKGTNRFVIKPGEQELNIRYQPLRTLLQHDPDSSKAYLFHRSGVVPSACTGCHTEQLPENSGLDVAKLSRNADFSPVCYSCHKRLVAGSQWLHGPAASFACMTCHRGGEGERKITVLVDRVDETCFSCHINKRKWTRKSFVHGPAATGDCTVCHDPHGDKNPYMLWADPKTDLCIACHSDKQKSPAKNGSYYEHGIIVGNGCSACHNPHATDFRFQLGGKINDVCVSCHISLQGVDEGHPVGGHPLSGTDDPRRKGRELSCSSCHNPHGGRYPQLLIGRMLGGHVCSKCHN